ncbi:MAG: acyl carrier protein [Planctomycetota bacterium]|nr:acyl carrier protein [Planctomycetota bacterium]
MTDTIRTVLEVLSLVSGRDAAEIRPEMDLVADLGIDSPKAVRLLVELEERLDIEIDDELASRMSTVGDVLDHVAARG